MDTERTWDEFTKEERRAVIKSGTEGPPMRFLIGCTKVCYLSRKEADEAAAEIAECHGSQQMRSYYCPDCLCWHLTRKPTSFDDGSRQAERDADEERRALGLERLP